MVIFYFVILLGLAIFSIAITDRYLKISKNYKRVTTELKNLKSNEHYRCCKILDLVMLDLFSESAVDRIINIIEECICLDENDPNLKEKQEGVYLTLFERQNIVGLKDPRFRQKWTSISYLYSGGTNLALPYLDELLLSRDIHDDEDIKSFAGRAINKIKERESKSSEKM